MLIRSITVSDIDIWIYIWLYNYSYQIGDLDQKR